MEHFDLHEIGDRRLYWAVIVRALADYHGIGPSAPVTVPAIADLKWDAKEFLTRRFRIEPFLRVVGIEWERWQQMIKNGIPKPEAKYLGAIL